MHGNLIDLSGKQFDKLTVIARLARPSKHKTVYWFCLCECGTEVHASSLKLKEGSATCCRGCRSIDDVFGKKFGRWTVIDKNFRKMPHGTLRNCICECGTQKWVSQSRLKRGETKSCGCLARELASIRITKMLTKHGLSKTREYKLNQGHKRLDRIKNNSDGTVTTQELIKHMEKFGNKCVYCTNGKYEHIEHVIPLSKGGRHSLDNIVPSCAKCNLTKKDKLPFITWLPEISDVQYLYVERD